jgi:nicotinamide mononucleotide transporter
MSIIGWYMWMKKDKKEELVLHITNSDKKEWLQQITFFIFFYLTIFLILTYFKKQFYDGVIPWADAFASATAFTGMWLMTKKKVESWYWWIATNIASIPLYFVKHYVFTSLYYIVLLIMAIFGLFEWIKKVKINNI